MRDTSKTIAVGIPCDAAHIPVLQAAVDSIHEQTLKPGQILISISNVDQHIKLASNIPYKIFYNKEKLSPGQNRNIIMENNVNDYVIFQDADDLSHPSRIQLVLEAFSITQTSLFLVHSYVLDKPVDHNSSARYMSYKDFKSHNITLDEKNIFIFNKRHAHHCSGPLGMNCAIHNGCISIKKELFESIRWTNKPSGEDVEFIDNCIAAGIKGVAINSPLYYYRNSLSSY